MEKIKISNHQVFSLMASYTIGSAILVIPASVASVAKQDAWISMLFTMLFGFLEVSIICFFWSRYPGFTFIEIVKDVFGKWIGIIVAVCFAFFSILSDSQVLWYVGNFITSAVMTETPAYVINFVFCVAVVIALLYGLEAIARSYELLIYFVSVLFIASMVLVTPAAKIEYVQPVLEKGIIPVLQGSIILSSFLIFPMVILLVIFPANAENSSKSRKSFIKGYLWGGFLVFLAILFSVLVLGSTMTADSQYPVYTLAKEINVGLIFTRLEFIVAGVWITTILIKVIAYFYAGVISLSQAIGLKDHKRIIIPLGLIILVMSEVVYPDVIYQANWDIYPWPLYVVTYGLVLPIIMLVVYFLKNLFRDKAQGE